jgi:hypothetical protein
VIFGLGAFPSVTSAVIPPRQQQYQQRVAQSCVYALQLRTLSAERLASIPRCLRH